MEYLMNSTPGTVAVIGGTGDLGGALARRWVRGGRKVIIGSRDAARAATAAAQLSAEFGRTIPGMSNRDAAQAADIVVVTVPFAVQRDILSDIRAAVQGKLVVDATVPLMPPKVMRVQLPAEGCAALIAQQILGEAVQVTSAFHNVSAHRLATEASIECDILVFGDKKDARAQVIELAAAAGLRGLHAGALANSAAAEALTSVLIFINKTYANEGAGIRITGTLKEPTAT
jgi:8-hydroxy-5-deazaflavin:NADPH oxidoreductase